MLELGIAEKLRTPLEALSLEALWFNEGLAEADGGRRSQVGH
jgi:hypothetical protein